jgi:hypothetical protein
VARMKYCSLLLATVVCLSPAPALAAILPIGPFLGNINETWESFPNFQVAPNFYLDDPTAIFGGAAMISNPVMAVYEPSAGAIFSWEQVAPLRSSRESRAWGSTPSRLPRPSRLRTR